jgi:hypothetical protein
MLPAMTQCAPALTTGWVELAATLTPAHNEPDP